LLICGLAYGQLAVLSHKIFFHNNAILS